MLLHGSTTSEQHEFDSRRGYILTPHMLQHPNYNLNGLLSENVEL